MSKKGQMLAIYFFSAVIVAGAIGYIGQALGFWTFQA